MSFLSLALSSLRPSSCAADLENMTNESSNKNKGIVKGFWKNGITLNKQIYELCPYVYWYQLKEQLRPHTYERL